MISVDHWPAALLSIAGHPVIQTPTVDALARNGVRFTNVYAECPICIPARRTLMTGMTPRGHGDRVYQDTLTMPAVVTLADAFRMGGYQTLAVGKTHTYPQRARIGFDDVILDEEGRTQYGVTDDYEMFLADAGFAGRQFEHGINNNEYFSRPWHLPEYTHVTNWATRQMTRAIKRRDPTRPGFWFMSYRHPHPPLVPLACYLDLYAGIEIDEPNIGTWCADEDLPYAIATTRTARQGYNAVQTRQARRAFYALCTHVDHQIRLLVGTLREEGLLDNTVICFTGDHGDMLGDHGLWAKEVFYERSANIPLILVGLPGDERLVPGRTDDRLAGWRDVMPTLLGLCGLPVPQTVEGVSLVTGARRSWIYCEAKAIPLATRMVHDGHHKLIYYPVGNRCQLFDTTKDPFELHDCADRPDFAAVRARLTEILIGELYGGDEAWARNGVLIGLPNRRPQPAVDRNLSSQRGDHFPPPPITNLKQ